MASVIKLLENLLARMPFRLERHTIFYIDFEDKCP